MAAIALRLEQPQHTRQNQSRIVAYAFAFVAGTAMFLQAYALSAQDRPGSLADLAERISPSVVNITTSTTVAQSEDRPVIPEGSPLEDFFKDFMDRQQRPDQGPRRGSALGSGFVISDDGFIVTNRFLPVLFRPVTAPFVDLMTTSSRQMRPLTEATRAARSLIWMAT